MVGTATRSVVRWVPDPTSCVQDHAVVVVGDVGELRSAVDVPRHRRVGCGPKLLVDHDACPILDILHLTLWRSQWAAARWLSQIQPQHLGSVEVSRK